MKAFEHFAPTSLPEALDILAQGNGRAKAIAGGTDLMLHMRSGVATPESVVDIKRLPELQGIGYDKESGLLLGALTTLRALTRSAEIREHYPALANAAGLMASEQIRSFATVGGNLCNASPSADLAPPLMAMDATVHLSALGGERQMPLESFFLGPGVSALQPGELLKEIHVPPPAGQTLFIKQSPREFMDIAVVCIALNLEMTGGVCRRARLILGAVAPVPLRAHDAEAVLVGRPVTRESISAAAEAAARACSPIDDVRGSAWYRRRMVAVLTRRGLEALANQNGQGGQSEVR